MADPGSLHRTARHGRTPVSDRLIDFIENFSRQLPGQRVGGFDNLFRSFGAAERAGDTRALDRPADDQFRKRSSQTVRNLTQPIDEVVILFPLIALEHRVFL